MTPAQQARFDVFVSPEPNTGCWLWAGSVQWGGYGRVMSGGRMQLAHRASYERHVGPIPAGLVVDHLCRQRSCVNPAHMEVVTIAENNRREDALITHCPKGHALSGENLYRAPKGGFRGCRTCRRAQSAAWNRRNS